MLQVASVREGIARTNRAFEEAVRKGDAAAMGKTYTTDGWALPPNGGTIKGRDNVGQFWQAVLGMGLATVKLQTLEFEEHDDTAWEVGQGILEDKDGNVLDEAKYIVIWKKEEGEWRWHRDIWNSNLSPQK